MTDFSVSINDMRGGLRTEVDATRIAQAFTPDCENVIFDGQAVKVRPGRVQHGDVLVETPGAPRTISETTTTAGNAFLGAGRANFDWFKQGSGLKAAISFRAPCAGSFTAAYIPWRTSSGYGSGDTGRYTISFQHDDGNGHPDGNPVGGAGTLTNVDMRTYMSSTDAYVSLTGGVFGSNMMTEGEIGHIVITNTSSSPSSNWSSMNTVMDEVQDWADWMTSGTTARLQVSDGGAWEPWQSQSNPWGNGTNSGNGSHVALILYFAPAGGGDPVVFGSGYQSNAMTSPLLAQSGSVMFGEYIEWTGAETVVTSIALAMKKVGTPGALWYRIESLTSASAPGTVLATGVMDTSALVSTRMAWATATLATSVTLQTGGKYRLSCYPISGSGSNYYACNAPYSFNTSVAKAATWGGATSCAQTCINGTTWTSDATSDIPFKLTSVTREITVESVPSIPAGVLALCEYHNPSMTATDTLTRLVAVGSGNGRVYATNGVGQLYDDNAMAIRNDSDYLTVNTTALPRLAQFKESVYVVDSQHAVRKFFGVDTSSFTSTCFGDGSATGIALDLAGNLYSCEGHAIVKYNTSHAEVGWFGYNGSTVGYHTSGTPASSAANGGFSMPNAVAVGGASGSEYLIVADTWNNRVQKISLASATLGNHVWTKSTFDSASKTIGSPVAVVVLSDGTVIVGCRSSTTGYLVKLAGSNGADTAHVAVLCAGDAAAANFYIYSLAVDAVAGTMYSTIRGSKVGSGGAGHVMTPYYVQAYTISSLAVDDYWTGNYYTGLVYNADTLYAVLNGASSDTAGIYTYTISGGELVLNSVSYKVDCYGMAISGDGTWYLSHPAAENIETTVVVPGDPYNWVEVGEEVSPSIAPVVAGITGTLLPSTYDVTYTYARRLSAGLTEYSESQPSPFATYTMSAAGGMSVVVTHDAAANLSATNGDEIYIYLRGGQLESFHRVASIPSGSLPASGGTSTVNIASIDASSPPLDPYVSRPPAGCTILMEWQGRMVYVGPEPQGTAGSTKDVLHISKWDDPDHIAPLDYVNDPEQYGIWVRIGTDGGEITGLGRIGSYLVVLKKRGVWLVSGEPGTATFSVQGISESVGCVSHETVQQVGGTLLVWLGASHLWGFDGQTFVDIGETIQPTLDGMIAAGNEARAFAVYDPERKWYALTIPRGTTTDTPSEDSLVLYPIEGGGMGWTRWTGQPGAVATYLHHVDVPGVYAADSGNAMIYRLHTGTVDATPDDTTVDIPWSWQSKTFLDPAAGAFKSVRKIAVTLSTPTPSGHSNLVATLGRMGGTDHADTTLALSADTLPQSLLWHPPALSDVRGYHVSIAGASNAALELLDVNLEVNLKGRVR